MNKWGTWEIIPPNECFSPSNLADFVFSPNKETKDKYNAGLDFQISGSPGAQISIPLHITSLFQPWTGGPRQELTPGTKQPPMFCKQIKFSFSKSDSRQDVLLIFNCQSFTFFSFTKKELIFNESFAKGKLGNHNNFWSLQPWTLQKFFLEKSFNYGTFLTEGSPRIKGFPGSIFLFPLIYSSPLSLSHKNEFTLASLYSQLIQWDVMQSYPFTLQTFDFLGWITSSWNKTRLKTRVCRVHRCWPGSTATFFCCVL